MALLDLEAKNILQSAGYNIISNLFSNLIFIFIVHLISLNKDNPSLQQSGINIGNCVISIIYDSMIASFSQGLKILYAQYDAARNLQGNSVNENLELPLGKLPKNHDANNQNEILYLSIILTWIIGLILFLFSMVSFDFIFGTLLSYDQVVLDYARIGMMYMFISRIVMVVYDYTRSQLLGLKVFGPFALIQTCAFFICLAISLNFSEIGMKEGGMILIFHEVLKVIMLIIYIRYSEKQSIFSSFSIAKSIKCNIQAIRRLKDLIVCFKDIYILILCDYAFFNISVILAGGYSPHQTVACICFSITNNFMFKVVFGLSESVTSFCGTSLTNQNYRQVKSYLNHSITILLIFKLITILGILQFKEQWETSFSLDPLALQAIDDNKYIYLLTLPFDGVQLLYVAYLQTIEHKDYASKITIISYFGIGIPLMILFGNTFDMKVGGIWLAIGIANAINCYYFIKRALQCDLIQSYQLASKNLQTNQLVSQQQTLLELPLL